MDKNLQELLEKHPLPKGCTLIETMEPNPEKVLEYLNQLKGLVSPKDAKIVQKAIDKYITKG
jgi:uncharacterized protein YlzI (FlbEa/FlbD family)